VARKDAQVSKQLRTPKNCRFKEFVNEFTQFGKMFF